MKVILLDDENLALKYLENQLQHIANVNIVGKFMDPISCKQALLHEEVDLVFMDIHLPEMDGIELAEQILEIKPKLNIVFVTAYDDYAIKAFELNALDYVLKPVGKERLLKTLKRIQEREEEAAVDQVPTVQTLRVQLFQQFSIATENGRVAPVRWRTTKAQELFLYLLQHRGHLIRKSVLIDILWPEFEPEKAYSQLYTAVYHIRKTLEPFRDHIKIANVTDGYILNTDNVLLDVEEWENQISSGQPVNADTIEEYEQVMGLYRGDYLQELDGWWVESERHRLKLLWIRTSFQMAEWYTECGQPMKAVDTYREICERHPQVEEAHFALMRIYASMNSRLSVHRQYRMLETALMEEMGKSRVPVSSPGTASGSKSIRNEVSFIPY